MANGHHQNDIRPCQNTDARQGDNKINANANTKLLLGTWAKSRTLGLKTLLKFWKLTKLH